ncbi:shikimate dehydrogenase [Pectinatus haikarae]|uniref:Shikimate dehydrogenase (NADP(+)) n=1 Tax=Pectinatus haikarae TaxID=349096 RepID=A0ABT9Y981_9FIRM|nr:shikimate dehydrogenase [Pectinatus haikarae]MDQ0204193.1 shikimate dehydrogenase [Pectinatus haikarae]
MKEGNILSAIYTGKTKNLGVIGYPIHHSLSPVIQNTALQSMHLDYAYIAMPVRENELEAAVKGLKALNFTGFNITIPHKINIIKYLDEIDQSASLIGAVNTVLIKNDRLYGYNTDYEGFISAFQSVKFTLKRINTVVLGAGGAARAVIYGLLHAGVGSVHIAARNAEKAKKLANDFKELGNISSSDWNEKMFQEILPKTDLLVNTTPLGMDMYIDKMPPVDITMLPSNAFVYDIIYTPEKTKLLVEAEKYGYTVLNGEYMLAGQGAAALEKWSGCGKIDVDLMRIALHEALLKKL